jgi:protein-disulfide isomerase
LVIGVVSLLAIAVVALGAARAEHKATTPERADLEGAIHQYLLEHPEVIIEAVEVLRAREQADKVAGARDQIELQREKLINDPTSPIGGNPDGDVTLVEFFDYHCGYCKRVLGDLLVLLDDDPNVRIVYKEFPILGPQSVTAARIALAANRQDPSKYMEFHVALMASRARLNEERALQMALEMGFDVDGLKADMNSDEISRILQDNNELARALGINGTPSFVIGDELIPGAVSVDVLKELIETARAAG